VSARQARQACRKEGCVGRVQVARRAVAGDKGEFEAGERRRRRVLPVPARVRARASESETTSTHSRSLIVGLNITHVSQAQQGVEVGFMSAREPLEKIFALPLCSFKLYLT
jgi:hypothetical protein